MVGLCIGRSILLDRTEKVVLPSAVGCVAKTLQITWGCLSSDAEDHDLWKEIISFWHLYMLSYNLKVSRALI